MMCSVSQFMTIFSPKLLPISPGVGSRAPKSCNPHNQCMSTTRDATLELLLRAPKLTSPNIDFSKFPRPLCTRELRLRATACNEPDAHGQLLGTTCNSSCCLVSATKCEPRQFAMTPFTKSQSSTGVVAYLRHLGCSPPRGENVHGHAAFDSAAAAAAKHLQLLTITLS